MKLFFRYEYYNTNITINGDVMSDDNNKLKVKVRQSEDGRKKKIKIENDCLEIKIRIKDKDVCIE